jgi:hypothetical protein
VALIATAGWFVLVVWRTSRNRAAIWKSLVPGRRRHTELGAAVHSLDGAAGPCSQLSIPDDTAGRRAQAQRRHKLRADLRPGPFADCCRALLHPRGYGTIAPQQSRRLQLGTGRRRPLGGRSQSQAAPRLG